MTFDDALEEAENVKQNKQKLVEIINQLKETYTPQLNLTQEDVDKLNRNTTVAGNVYREETLLDTYYEKDTRLLDVGSMYLDPLVARAFLYPDTIHVVDD